MNVLRRRLFFSIGIYFATGLALLSLEQAIAANVSGTTKSIPQMIPVKADIIVINNTTGDTSITQSDVNGNFALHLNPDNYKFLVVANNHGMWIDPSVSIAGDTSFDFRVIRTQNNDGSPIMHSTHPTYNGHIIDFTKSIYERSEAASSHEVSNWANNRRRLYIDPTITGQSRANLETLLARNESLSISGIYYDEKLTDSLYGVKIIREAPGGPNIGNKLAMTYPLTIRVSENPVIDQIVGAEIYVRSTISIIPIYLYADEFRHVEGQHHHSVDSTHTLTQPGITSIATTTTFDESYIGDIWQTLKLGEDLTKHKDTVGTIRELIITPYNPGWNMVSVPTREASMLASSVFSEKVGNAFKYVGGYQSEDTLKNGVGYWIKLNEALPQSFTGTPVTVDTLEVMIGWNMIGALGTLTAVSSIEQNPSGFIVSNFFGYNGAYEVSDTLHPGQAYWVKANGPGKLILRSTTNLLGNIPKSFSR